MAGDANYDKVSLLLHGNGANGSSVFTDNSQAPLTPTLIGSPVISTAHSGIMYGGAAMAFNGSTDALQYAHTAALNLATGDFTIEAWIFLNSLTNGNTICQKDQSFGSTFTSYAFRVAPSGALVATVGTGNSASYATDFNSPAGAVAAGVRTHVAYVRYGTSLMLFAGGTIVATATQTGTPADGGKPMLIGRYPAGGGTADAWFNGEMDDFRITKGLARYTANFTPPAQQFADGFAQIAGTVTDAAGAPASRIVRAYRRDTGALVGSATSDGTTGAYSIWTPTADEVTVIALDSATSGTYYDDVCERVIPA